MSIGRPEKPRNTQIEPKIRQFSPRGRHGRPGYTNLKYDQFEALRLVDLEGLSQKESAKAMGVSQQTLSRIVRRARKVLIKGIAEGTIINIKLKEKEALKDPKPAQKEAHK